MFLDRTAGKRTLLSAIRVWISDQLGLGFSGPVIQERKVWQVSDDHESDGAGWQSVQHCSG
ncbi:MAG: hypothetical protein DWH81_05295 [Planctomycetota bacterium]|nr:MAG: hypothetical protein DWH81_05295 [Planctomycetota bacterium]